MNDREKIFAKKFFDNSRQYDYHPKTFNLNGTRYTPDFLDKRTGTYIEVVGSRQAYSQNREKYSLMADLFPEVKFEVRGFTGELYEPKKTIIRNETLGVKTLSILTGYSKPMISMILSGKKRPGLSGALKLEAVTGIPVAVWANGSTDQIVEGVRKWKLSVN